MIDLEAIRARNAERYQMLPGDYDRLGTTTPTAATDIDALIAEVERLRVNTERAHRVRDCECGHLPMMHDSILKCVSCDAEVGCH